MKVVASTDEYTIFQRRDGRYAVQGANRKAVNGDEKVAILLKHELISAPAPKAPEVEEPEAVEEEAEAAAPAEAAAEEPAAEEPAAEEPAAEAPAAEEEPNKE